MDVFSAGACAVALRLRAGVARLQNGKAQQPGREGAYRAGADGVYGVQPADAVRHRCLEADRRRVCAAACALLCAAGAAALPARRRAVRRGAGHQAAGAAVRPGAGGVLSGGNYAGKGPPARLWPLLWRRGAGTAAAAADRSAFFWRCAVDPEADRQIHRHNVRLPLRDDQRL